MLSNYEVTISKHGTIFIRDKAGYKITYALDWYRDRGFIVYRPNQVMGSFRTQYFDIAICYVHNSRLNDKKL